MPNSQIDTRSDAGAFFAILRRRSWLIALAILAAVGFALVYSSLQDKQYRSTAVLLFRQTLLDVQLTGVPLVAPSNNSTVESATNVGLVSQQNVRVRAASRLGPAYSADSLEDSIEIEPQKKSDLVGVEATAGSPGTAARVANALAAAYLEIANEQALAKINGAADQVRSRINTNRLSRTQRRGLRDSLIKLTVLGAVGPQYVQLVQSAVPPTKAFSPKPLRNALIGGLIGLVIGLALVFGVEHFDRRLRRPEEVERESGLPLLATVPRSAALRDPLRRGWPRGQDTESFRQLASFVRYPAGRPGFRSVLLVSPGSGSGTTTIALHLARAASNGSAEQVLLVEANLRRPALGTLLKVPTDRGLSTPGLTSGEGDVQVVDVGGDGDRTLSLIPAGPRVDDPAAVLESVARGDLIPTSHARYALDRRRRPAAAARGRRRPAGP